jgi:hypothetical protein
MNSSQFEICSECFLDFGLKIDAFQVGIENSSECLNCKSQNGKKLNKQLIDKLCYRFFVRGSILKANFGGAPTLMFNEYHFGKGGVHFSKLLTEDVKLLEKTGNFGFFYYAPNAWMIGETEPLKLLQSARFQEFIIKDILEKYPTLEIGENDLLFRLRVNPNSPNEESNYDAPPQIYSGNGRFDSQELSVLYCSQDLEICIHECRVSVEDELYLATLKPVRKLRLLNLKEDIIEENINIYSSLDLSIKQLFGSGKESYKICKRIAIEAKKSGFDGIVYPSFFSSNRDGILPYGSIDEENDLKENNTKLHNVCIFGKPIQDSKLSVHCINKLHLNRIKYEFSFGPLELSIG